MHTGGVLCPYLPIGHYKPAWSGRLVLEDLRGLAPSPKYTPRLERCHRYCVPPCTLFSPIALEGFRPEHPFGVSRPGYMVPLRVNPFVFYRFLPLNTVFGSRAKLVCPRDFDVERRKDRTAPPLRLLRPAVYCTGIVNTVTFV